MNIVQRLAAIGQCSFRRTMMANTTQIAQIRAEQKRTTNLSDTELITFLRKVSNCGSAEQLSDRDFVLKYKIVIERMGRILKCLELAETESKSFVGWAALPALREFLMLRLRRKSRARGVSLLETIRANGIFEIALEGLHRDLWPQVTEATKRLILELGLAREIDDGTLKPTRLMNSVYAQIQNNRCRRFYGHPPKRIIPRCAWSRF
jgi:hypothetical protein